MPNNFCRRLTNAVYLIENAEGNVHYQPCCWVGPVDGVSEKTSLVEIRQHTESQVMADTSRYCKECIKRERYQYQDSQRLMANKFIPSDASDWQVQILEVQVDSRCNAACTICGPQFSSLWRKQLNKTYKIENVDYRAQEIIKEIDLSHLARVGFMGGEPLLSRIHLDILMAVPHPENVVVKYSTNGSIKPSDKVVEVWKRFKRVEIIFSIDGTEKVFEYIRWPLKWDSVKEHIQYVKQLGGNIFPSINYTVNPMNAYYFSELEQWATVHGLPVSVSVCSGIWSTAGLPAALSKKIIAKFGTEHKVSKMLSGIDEITSLTMGLVKNMTELDQKRGTSWKDTFADVVKYYEESS